MLDHIFVYGTLKTGQCRAHQWPIRPLEIRHAWTLGRLYDTGPYPALVSGADRVAGQVWSFDDSDIGRVFEVLDKIEGTNQPGQRNQYDRSRLTITLASGQQLTASGYVFARLELLPGFTYLTPTLAVEEAIYAIWPPNSSWT
jgi:gamma-glutamylcyclotransferase (GGCT)/AIG2-like uncharacterized protein YtfP